LLASDPVRDALISKSDLFFWGLVSSTAILFVGVMMEEFHPLDRLPTHDVNIRTKVRNPRKWIIRSKFLYAKLALLVVVGGLAGEGIFEYLASRAETEIRQHDEEIVSDNEGEVAAVKADNLKLGTTLRRRSRRLPMRRKLQQKQARNLVAGSSTMRPKSASRNKSRNSRELRLTLH
jgi:hypothetical protein